MESSKTINKPDMNSSDTSSILSQCNQDQPQQQQQQPNLPEWINEFNKECIKICGTRCSEKLDEIMEAYIKEIKQELVLCDTSPNRASLIANRMSKTLLFFYLYYSDIKEFFVISQWNENISLLLLFYCRLELKAAHRVHRGKDSDSMVCSRIMSAMWIYLNYNSEAMIHVVLQVPGIGRRHKDILDPIFRKLLLSKKQKPLTELEYIRNLLAFKLWKRLYSKDDKKAISHLALTELRPPRSFLAHHRKYKFLPPCPNSIDIHMQFVTGLIDLDSAIKDYLEIFHKNKRTDYHPTEKKSFISDFCSSFEGLDTTTDDLSDTYMLDRIKNENDIEEIDDDDCIIIEPEELPPPIIRTVPPDPAEVIDLTADEPENQINLTEPDDVPIWCKELLKQSETLKNTPPPTPLPEENIAEPIDVIIQSKDAPEMEAIPDTVLTPEDSVSLKAGEEPNRSPTPNDILLDDDSFDNMTEITSTSHHLDDTAPNLVDSSVLTPSEIPPEQSVKVVNFEHVDSTSNINEDESETEEPMIEKPMTEDPIIENPIIEEPKIDEPMIEEPMIEEPMIEEPMIQEPVIEKPMIEEPAIEEPTIKEPEIEKPVIEEPEIEKQNIEEPNIEESEINEPTVKVFEIEQTTIDGIVCSAIIGEITTEPEVSEEEIVENISEKNVSAVCNIEFEKFASAQNGTTSIDGGTMLSNIAAKSDDNLVETNKQVSDSDDLNDDILDENSCHLEDRAANRTPTDTNLLNDKESENSVNSHTEIEEFTSPAIEPMSVKDFANYLAGYYEEFSKQPEHVNGELTLNKKRKIDEHSVRTYTKRTPKLDVVPEITEPEPEQEPIYQPQREFPPNPPKEQRVPANGERVIRFQVDVFEQIVTGSLKINSNDYKLFAPVIFMSNDNPHYWIPEVDVYPNSNNSVATNNIPIVENDPPLETQVPVFENLHTLNTGSTSKKILERQDYLKSTKGEENPRVRVIKRPTIGFGDPKAKDMKMPDLVPQTKKRGTVSPDLNINLTLPKFESLSLNSSFQHHFCTDISACTSESDCFISNYESVNDIPSHITTPIVSMNSPPGMSYEKPSTSQPFGHTVGVKTDGISSPLPSTSSSSAVATHSAPVPTPNPGLVPILPAEVPYWHEIESAETQRLGSPSHSQTNVSNLLVNINLDQLSTDHEIHLPIKKRRVSSLKVELKDELSYPSTPMISIAELESIETERNKANVSRPFKTPAELKEVPPLPSSYICNMNPVNHVMNENFNINHTYNNPTINYHVNNVPVINFQYNPHYQLPTIPPIIVPMNHRTPIANWDPTSYGYVKLPTAGPRKQASTDVVKKRKVGRRKSTRPPAESLLPTPVEQNPETTPWRFSVS